MISRAVYDSMGRGEVIEILLAHGADPTIPNKSGISAIMLADKITDQDVKQFFPRDDARDDS